MEYDMKFKVEANIVKITIKDVKTGFSVDLTAGPLDKAADCITDVMDKAKAIISTL